MLLKFLFFCVVLVVANTSVKLIRLLWNNASLTEQIDTHLPNRDRQLYQFSFLVQNPDVFFPLDQTLLTCFIK